MNTRKKFKFKINNLVGGDFPITIGRIMQALANLRGDLTCDIYEECSYSVGVIEDLAKIIERWKLTKENGQECTDDDQNIETIEKLLELLK